MSKISLSDRELDVVVSSESWNRSLRLSLTAALLASVWVFILSYFCSVYKTSFVLSCSYVVFVLVQIRLFFFESNRIESN